MTLVESTSAVKRSSNLSVPFSTPRHSVEPTKVGVSSLFDPHSEKKEPRNKHNLFLIHLLHPLQDKPYISFDRMGATQSAESFEASSARFSLLAVRRLLAVPLA